MIRPRPRALLAGAALLLIATGAPAAPASSARPIGPASSAAPVGQSSLPPLHRQHQSAHYTHHGDVADEPSSTPPDHDTPSAPVDGRSIVSVTIRATGDGPGRTVTFGQVFRKTAVAAGRTVVARVDGRRLPTQVDPKARWSDGSLRHAVITVRLPRRPARNKASRIDLVAAARPDAGAAPIRIGDLLATGFQGRITFHGAVGAPSADARSLLRAAADRGGCPAWGRQCKRWLSGPLVSEWIVGGPTGGADSHLAVYFHVRAYRGASGNISRARVDTVVENDWAYTPDPHDLHYVARLHVGDDTSAPIPLTHYRQARWHRVAWWQGDPDLYAGIDTAYLQSTGAISKYADVQPDADVLDKLAQHYAPMSHGAQTVYMPQTGAQAGIGPLPRWSSLYAVSGDRRAFGYMLANDSAAGTYGFHYRDRQTGRPLRITDHPYVTLANHDYASHAGGKLARDLLPTCHRDCHSPVQFDTAHQPSIGYLPYLVTGDFYYLEEMQFAASFNELAPNQEYRKLDQGILRQAHGQVRDQAWSLRAISDAAFATPDADPMKTYFTGVMQHILDDYNDHYVGTGISPLHILTNGTAFPYAAHGRPEVAIAPWQTDFFTWAVGHAAEQDMPGAKTLLDWLSPWQIQRATGWLSDADRGYCWIQASAYNLQVRDTRHSPFYRSMDAVYAHNFPRELGLDCDSDAELRRLSSGSYENLGHGQMVGYADSPTGFPANYQIGLAAAADSDAKDGQRAWSIFAHRSHQPDYADYPNFAVVPRSAASD